MTLWGAEIKARCVDLRLRDCWTYRKIAAETDVPYATVRSWLRGIRGDGPRPRRVSQPKVWTKLQDDRLRQIYPVAPWPRLLQEFSFATHKAIKRRAQLIRVRRQVMKSDYLLRHIPPVCTQLRQERQRLRITQEMIAKRLGYAAGALVRWESGKSAPNMRQLMDWASGLGFELILRPKVDAPPSRSPVTAAHPHPDGSRNGQSSDRDFLTDARA